MFAVFATGGKQYRVRQGQVIKVETLPHEAGNTIDFNELLLVSNGEDVEVGKPHVDGGKVTAEVVSHGRARKVKILKFRRRKNSIRRAGHRQNYIELKITAISAKNVKAKPKPKVETTPKAKTAKKPAVSDTKVKAQGAKEATKKEATKKVESKQVQENPAKSNKTDEA